MWYILTHYFKWLKTCKAHIKVCHASTYIYEQIPFNEEAWQILHNKTWELFELITNPKKKLTF